MQGMTYPKAVERATRRFLQGTCYKTPYEAIKAGARTYQDWVKTLEESKHSKD